MQSAQDRGDTSKPTKYSILCLPFSQHRCDLFGSSTSEQGQPNYTCFPPLVTSGGKGGEQPFAAAGTKALSADEAVAHLGTSNVCSCLDLIYWLICLGNAMCRVSCVPISAIAHSRSVRPRFLCVCLCHNGALWWPWAMGSRRLRF